MGLHVELWSSLEVVTATSAFLSPEVILVELFTLFGCSSSSAEPSQLLCLLSNVLTGVFADISGGVGTVSVNISVSVLPPAP